MATASPSPTIAPFKFMEPVTKINGQVPGITTIEFPPNKRINLADIEVTATKAALGAGTYSIPLPSDAVGLMQWKMNGKPERTRMAAELFGATGLNALCDVNAGGTVLYTQAANGNLSTKPVLIGSAADLAQQALLTANTITNATFWLPFLFCEPYRKEYDETEAGGFVTGYADGTSVGTVTLELTNVANANISGVTFKCWYEYDEMVAPAGSTIYLMKEYRQGVQYAAAGDIECATQLQQLRAGDGICRISLLTTADVINRVVVKQGSRVLRDLTNFRAQESLIRRDYNPAAIIMNRFDLEFDLNDDPASSPVNQPAQPLSIVATLATANDATKMIQVLASYWGPLD